MKCRTQPFLVVPMCCLEKLRTLKISRHLPLSVTRDRQYGVPRRASGSVRLDQRGHKDLKEAYSDHRPLWICFDTTLASQDSHDLVSPMPAPTSLLYNPRADFVEKDCGLFAIVSAGKRIFLLNRKTGKTWVLVDKLDGDMWKVVDGN